LPLAVVLAPPQSGRGMAEAESSEAAEQLCFFFRRQNPLE